MLKKIFFITFVLLLTIDYSSALEVSSCNSGGDEWTCQTDKICICEISGDCTNGNLFVYDTNFLTPLCLPKIDDGKVNIEWDQCQSTTKEVKVMANCYEGNSSEKIIQLIEYVPTTSSIKTTTIATTTTNLIPCQSECCENMPGFLDKECEKGLVCCSSGEFGGQCKKNVDECFVTQEKKRGSGIFIIIAIIGLIVIVGLVLYFMNVIKLPPKKDIYKL